MLGAGAAISAMASLLWGGDAGAAESERLNSHVTAAEAGRGSGREPEPHSEREICWGGCGGGGGVRGSLASVWRGVSNGGGVMW